MDVNKISFGNVYKINTNKRDVFEVKEYIEKNRAQNPKGFATKNSDVRIFDDLSKNEPAFCFENRLGDCFILTGREGAKAWEYTLEMMDSWEEAGKYYGTGDELDRMYDHYAKIAQNKIEEIVNYSPTQEVNVNWRGDKPNFDVVG